MNRHTDNNWWQIFTSDSTAREQDSCPIVPVSSGQVWQKGLAVLYCPCIADPHADECQLPLI